MKESGLLEGMFFHVFLLQGERHRPDPPIPWAEGHFLKMMCFFVFHKVGYVRLLEGNHIYDYIIHIIGWWESYILKASTITYSTVFLHLSHWDNLYICHLCIGYPDHQHRTLELRKVETSPGAFFVWEMSTGESNELGELHKVKCHEHQVEQ